MSAAERMELLEGRYDRIQSQIAEWSKEIRRVRGQAWARDSGYLAKCQANLKVLDLVANELAGQIMDLADEVEDQDLDSDAAQLAYRRGFLTDSWEECQYCGEASIGPFCSTECRLAWERVHGQAFVEGHPHDTSGDRFKRDKVGEMQ